MKKIISLCISLVLLAGLCIPMTVSASTFTPTILMDEDFESVGNATTTNYFNGTNRWNWPHGATHNVTVQTNRAALSFETENGNTVFRSNGICENGYFSTGGHVLTSEYNGTEAGGAMQAAAYRLVENKFATAFTAANFPDQKLVVSFDLGVTMHDLSEKCRDANSADLGSKNYVVNFSSLMIGFPASGVLGSQGNISAAYNLQLKYNQLSTGYNNGKSAITAAGQTEFENNYGAIVAEASDATAPTAQTMKITVVIDPGTSESIYINDVLAQTTTHGLSNVGSIAFALGSTVDFTFDNFLAYTVSDSFTMDASALDGASDLAVDTETAFTFNNAVSENSLSKIAITANGSTLTYGSDFSASLVADATTGLASKVKVNFPNKMAYNTDYVITFPADFSDASMGTLGSASSVSFSTLSLPEFGISTDITAKIGWGGTGAAITSLSEGAGKQVSFTATATNEETEATYGIFMIGLYDAGGNLVAMGSMDKTFAVGGTETLTCMLKLPADLTGYSVKAFVCGGMSDLTPFGDVTVLD